MLLAGALTLVQLNKIISPCDVPNQSVPSENISCDKALPYINDAMQKFGLATPEAKAMYLSTMDFESEKLTYARNHYPGTVGQGTYSMMMPDNLFKFVKDNAGTFSGTSISNLAVGEYNGADTGSKKTILNTLVEPKYAFMPGAWWITRGAALANGCSIDMNKSPTLVQAAEFMKKCIGVEPQGVRTTAYNSALALLKQYIFSTAKN